MVNLMHAFTAPTVLLGFGHSYETSALSSRKRHSIIRIGAVRAPCRVVRLVSVAAARDLEGEVVVEPPDRNIAESVWQCSWPRNFYHDYKLGDYISRGSFGRVYRARNRHTALEHAVKVLHKYREGVQGHQYEKKVMKEVALLQEVQDAPGCLQLLGVYEDNENVYIVSELCEGGSLAEFVAAHGVLSEREAARVLCPILEVLQACHSRGIVYGDIKPANFLLRAMYPAGHNPLSVCVADFGGAQCVVEGEQLRPGGTPAYMAPEVFFDTCGTASDMWGMGMLLYQLLSCKLPFFGSTAGLTPDSLMMALMLRDLEFEGSEWERVSPEAKDLVGQMLDRDPATRITPEAALHHPWFAKLQDGEAWALPDWAMRTLDLTDETLDLENKT